MKLSYNAVDTFYSPDIGDYGADPPLKFEMPSMRPDEWTSLYVDFRDAPTLDNALLVVANSLISIGQGDERWPINTVEDAEEIMQAIEDGNPGQGELFIINLAHRLSFRRFGLEAERLGNLLRSSTPSTNGIEEQTEVSAE